MIFPVCVIKAFVSVFALLLFLLSPLNVSMCLSYAKFFVIFHVGTKWFVCGKPNLWPAEASQKTDRSTRIALLKEK